MSLESLGFVLIPDFITLEEQTKLVSHLKSSPNKRTKSRNSIQRFGSKKPYNSNMISDKVPEHFAFALDRIMEQNLLPERPNSVSVNEYQIGQQITPHIDSRSSGPIISILSLLNEATMTFELRSIKHQVVIPARSLIQFKDDLRNLWKHSIEPVKAIRYSVVFRCAP